MKHWPSTKIKPKLRTAMEAHRIRGRNGTFKRVKIEYV